MENKKLFEEQLIAVLRRRGNIRPRRDKTEEMLQELFNTAFDITWKYGTDFQLHYVEGGFQLHFTNVE